MLVDPLFPSRDTSQSLLQIQVSETSVSQCTARNMTGGSSAECVQREIEVNNCSSRILDHTIGSKRESMHTTTISTAPGAELSSQPSLVKPPYLKFGVSAILSTDNPSSCREGKILIVYFFKFRCYKLK